MHLTTKKKWIHLKEETDKFTSIFVDFNIPLHSSNQ